MSTTGGEQMAGSGLRGGGGGRPRARERLIVINS